MSGEIAKSLEISVSTPANWRDTASYKEQRGADPDDDLGQREEPERLHKDYLASGTSRKSALRRQRHPRKSPDGYGEQTSQPFRSENIVSTLGSVRVAQRAQG